MPCTDRYLCILKMVNLWVDNFTIYDLTPNMCPYEAYSHSWIFTENVLNSCFLHWLSDMQDSQPLMLFVYVLQHDAYGWFTSFMQYFLLWVLFPSEKEPANEAEKN